MTADLTPGLARLIDERHATLNRHFLKRAAHEWDARDLTQELYLRPLRVDLVGDDIPDPEAYLFAVAAKLINEHATPSNAAAGLDRTLRRQRLADLMSRLAPKCRAALVMHYRDELGYRDIGEWLQVSTPMAKTYIVKALAACRAGMARHD